jgi:hypothetical protein
MTYQPQPFGQPPTPFDPAEFAEVALLLPAAELSALEARARGCGLTCAQLVRRVLRIYLTATDSSDRASRRARRTESAGRAARPDR